MWGSAYKRLYLRKSSLANNLVSNNLIKTENKKSIVFKLGSEFAQCSEAFHRIFFFFFQFERDFLDKKTLGRTLRKVLHLDRLKTFNRNSPI